MSPSKSPGYLALSGGVGGASLVLGLAQLLPPEDLTVVANTGDDFRHLGLVICPDLDTLLYTLAGWNNPQAGWGQADESWNSMDALARLGGETWFRLGDRDLATHLIRTQLLAEGKSLSEVTAQLSARMGIKHHLIPMTDDPVSTFVLTRDGARLAFQHYFVRDACAPRVAGFEFEGIAAAAPSPGFVATLEAAPKAVIICPSNPFVSVDPVLQIPGVLPRLKAMNAPLIAVSPIVGGRAIKGPAAKIMAELSLPQTALGIARYYQATYGDLLTGLVLDQQDAALADDIKALGLATTVTNTVMLTLQDKTELAAQVLEFAASL